MMTQICVSTSNGKAFLPENLVDYFPGLYSGRVSVIIKQNIIGVELMPNNAWRPKVTFYGYWSRLARVDDAIGGFEAKAISIPPRDLANDPTRVFRASLRKAVDVALDEKKTVYLWGESIPKSRTNNGKFDDRLPSPHQTLAGPGYWDLLAVVVSNSR